eukprot:COSAG04_NODE_183_length_21161_cov_4.562693_1_plen_1068_part_10
MPNTSEYSQLHTSTPQSASGRYRRGDDSDDDDARATPTHRLVSRSSRPAGSPPRSRGRSRSPDASRASRGRRSRSRSPEGRRIVHRTGSAGSPRSPRSIPHAKATRENHKNARVIQEAWRRWRKEGPLRTERVELEMLWRSTGGSKPAAKMPRQGKELIIEEIRARLGVHPDSTDEEAIQEAVQVAQTTRRATEDETVRELARALDIEPGRGPVIVAKSDALVQVRFAKGSGYSVDRDLELVKGKHGSHGPPIFSREDAHRRRAARRLILESVGGGQAPPELPPGSVLHSVQRDGHWEPVGKRDFDGGMRLVQDEAPPPTGLRFLPPEHNWVVSRYGLDLRPLFGEEACARHRRDIHKRIKRKRRHSNSRREVEEEPATEAEKEEALSQIDTNLSTLSVEARSELLAEVNEVTVPPGIPILTPTGCLEEGIQRSLDILGLDDHHEAIAVQEAFVRENTPPQLADAAPKLILIKENSVIEFRGSASGFEGLESSREFVEGDYLGEEQVLFGEPVGSIICAGPHGCTYYEIEKSTYDALTSAADRQIDALAKRVATAQHLAAEEDDMQTAKQLEDWFEAGETAGGQHHPSFVPPMSSALSINASGCDLNASALHTFFDGKVKFSSLRVGYNHYGDDGAKLIADNIADDNMEECRSLEVDTGDTGKHFFELVINVLEEVDLADEDGKPRFDDLTVVLGRRLTAEQKLVEGEEFFDVPEFVEAAEELDESWKRLLLGSLRDSRLRTTPWESLTPEQQKAGDKLGWDEASWDDSGVLGPMFKDIEWERLSTSNLCMAVERGEPTDEHEGPYSEYVQANNPRVAHGNAPGIPSTWLFLQGLAKDEDRDRVKKPRVSVAGGPWMTAKELMALATTIGYTSAVFDERHAYAKGHRLLRLHRFLNMPLDLAVAMSKVCRALYEHNPSWDFLVKQVGEDEDGYAERFDNVATEILKSCLTDKEAEYLLTQSWDRRAGTGKDLVQGLSVLDWAMQEPSLPEFVASQPFYGLYTRMWTRHSLYINDTSSDAVYIGSKTDETIGDFVRADDLAQKWERLRDTYSGYILWLLISALLPLSLA